MFLFKETFFVREVTGGLQTKVSSRHLGPDN